MNLPKPGLPGPHPRTLRLEEEAFETLELGVWPAGLVGHAHKFSLFLYITCSGGLRIHKSPTIIKVRRYLMVKYTRIKNYRRKELKSEEFAHLIFLQQNAFSFTSWKILRASLWLDRAF